MKSKGIKSFLDEYTRKETLVVQLRDRRTFNLRESTIKIENETMFGCNYDGISYFYVAIDCDEIATMRWSDKR